MATTLRTVHPATQWLVLLVVGCVCGMMGLVYPSVIPHQFDHATGHMAHSSPLCSWLCMAGPGSIVESLDVNGSLVVVELVRWFPRSWSGSPSTPRSVPRAPPLVASR